MKNSVWFRLSYKGFHDILTSAFLLTLFGILMLPSWGLIASAQAVEPELQRPGETFPSYFSRITRGGTFPGIYLDAPIGFADEFSHYIRHSYWVGPLDKTRRQLQEQGLDLWFDVYKTEVPQKFVKFSANFDGLIEHYCGIKINHVKLRWLEWPSCLRRAWIEEALFHQGLAQELSHLYGLNAQEVWSRTSIFLLTQGEFTEKIRKAGWDGPIYFRAATVPDPSDSKKRWVLLNDDLLKQKTPFESSTLQLFELVGIANHELSHVMQDFYAQNEGWDVEVRSAEQILLIEGMAEYLAEDSMSTIGGMFQLFAVEQAVEVVHREGNSQTGNLFPYTIGLPFVRTIYGEAKGKTEKGAITRSLIEILGRDTSLKEYLFKKFK